MSSKKKPYFPNNWKEIQSIPEEFLGPIEYEDLYEMRVCQWDIPSSVTCIMRVTNQTRNTVREFVYQRPHAARDRFQKEIETDDAVEIVLCTDSGLSLHTNYIPDDFEDLFEEPGGD